MTLTDEEIVRRLADGEDPWVIDPEHGCTNPLTGYFPTREVNEEKRRRAVSTTDRDHLVDDRETLRALRDLLATESVDIGVQIADAALDRLETVLEGAPAKPPLGPSLQPAKVIIEVSAGIVPGTPEPQFTRRWAITSAEWEKAQQEDMETNAVVHPMQMLLLERGAMADAYAAVLRDPARLNWTRTDWIWL